MEWCRYSEPVEEDCKGVDSIRNVLMYVYKRKNQKSRCVQEVEGGFKAYISIRDVFNHRRRRMYLCPSLPNGVVGNCVRARDPH